MKTPYLDREIKKSIKSLELLKRKDKLSNKGENLLKELKKILKTNE